MRISGSCTRKCLSPARLWLSRVILIAETLPQTRAVCGQAGSKTHSWTAGSWNSSTVPVKMNVNNLSSNTLLMYLGELFNLQHWNIKSNSFLLCYLFLGSNGSFIHTCWASSHQSITWRHAVKLTSQRKQMPNALKFKKADMGQLMVIHQVHREEAY